MGKEGEGMNSVVVMITKTETWEVKSTRWWAPPWIKAATSWALLRTPSAKSFPAGLIQLQVPAGEMEVGKAKAFSFTGGLCTLQGQEKGGKGKKN